MLTILDLCSHQTQKVSHLHPVAVDRMQMTILQIGSSEVAWTEVECNEDSLSYAILSKVKKYLRARATPVFPPWRIRS